MEECGKTVATSIESRLVPNALRGAGLSLAYVLRRAPGHTICWDEIDKELRKKGQEIDGWLTRGYQKGWLFGRADPNDPHRTIDYDPWCPKAIALIGKPWDRQVLSRCIPVEMRRKLDDEDVEDFDDTETYPMFDDLRKMAARWAADHLEPLRKPRPERPDGLRGSRSYDNWLPLLAIAEEIGGPWPVRARQAALALQAKGGHVPVVILLGDLKAIFEMMPDRGFWETAEIIDKLLEIPERDYDSTANRGRPINGKWLGVRLDDFEIKSSQPRGDNGQKRKRGYLVADFEDAFKRYLEPASPSDPCDPSDPDGPPSSGAGSDGSDGSDGQAGSWHESQPDADPTAELF